jgi:uncharacterized protein YjbJ (UPF0337 family)
MSGTRDRVEGELKEQQGKLTDDKKRETEGQAQQKWGEAKDKAEEAEEEALVESRCEGALRGAFVVPEAARPGLGTCYKVTKVF